MGVRYTVFQMAKKNGLSKTGLGKMAGLSSATIAKIGKDEIVSLDALLRICRVLHCQPGDLVSYEEETENALLQRMREEMQMDLKGGIYHRTQILLAYNSNHIEGSRLSEDQTRYIYETNTIGSEKEMESMNVDDIIETVNHFDAFRYVLNHAEDFLNESIIKEIHRILKSGTSDGRKEWFRVGDYKSRVNTINNHDTSTPDMVPHDMAELLEWYRCAETFNEETLIEFHFRFERIHPFQDGNGRVGRLILFKECLKNMVDPIIILDTFKEFYYRGLEEYPREKGYLTDTFLHGQDVYKGIMKQYGLLDI